MLRNASLTALIALLASPGVAAAQDAATELRDLNQRIELLRRGTEGQIDTLQERVRELEAELEATRAKAAAAASAPEPRVVPDADPVRITLKGRVGAAVLYADNGDDDQFFVVDNDNTESRFSFNGEADAYGLTAGTLIEIGLAYNSTDEIAFGQSESTDADFPTLRHAEAYIGGDAVGELALGFGNTATEDIAENDLSGTTSIAQSDVDDTAGGLSFANGIEVDSIFSNRDGDREMRVRYDTPGFAGFYVAASLREDGGLRPGVGLWYENDGLPGGFEAEAGVGWRSENDEDTFAGDSDVFVGSGSVLFPFGLNLTLAVALQVFDSDDNAGAEIADQTAYYAKLGYQIDAFPIGSTNLSVDVFYGEDAYFDTEIEAITSDGDDNAEALSFGGGVVQEIDDLAAEVYLGARWYDISLPDGSPAVIAGTDDNPDPLIAVLGGIRVDF